MNDRQNSLTRSTLLLTAVGLVAQLLAFFYRVCLSRLVGAETMGLYQLIMPVYSIFLSIAVTGLTVAISSLTASYVLPVLLLTGVENLTKHHFYGMGEVRLPAAVELGEQFVRTAAVLGLVWFFLPEDPSVTVALIVLGMLISEVFSSSSLTLLRKRQERGRTYGREERPVTGLASQMARVAIPVAATALLGNLMASANSILIPRKLMAVGLTESEAMSQFGVVFGMTVPLLNLPSAFIGALCLAIVPRLSQCQAKKRERECREKISKAILAASVIVLPATAFLVTLGPDLGELLFQNETVGDHLLPLAVGVVLGSYESVLASVLNGIGKQIWSAAVSLLCGALQLVFTVTVRLWAPSSPGFAYTCCTWPWDSKTAPWQ